MNTKAIAFYLPQFHPIQENDAWWGKGFTEWHKVVRARPFYVNHYQPRLPSDLGYYDLRVPETRIAQAELAKAYGLYGFCYYYYWFGGKKLLDRPIQAVLESREPDFPFCICWANENWTRRWDGLDNEVLISQIAARETEQEFIKDVLPFLKDDRYIRVRAKPLLLVYRPELLADSKMVTDSWREVAAGEGIGDLFLVRCEHGFKTRLGRPEEGGFDASCEFPPHRIQMHRPPDSFFLQSAADPTLNIWDYPSVAVESMHSSQPDYKMFRGVMLHWDNTPRQGKTGHIFENFSPEIYEWWLTEVCLQTIERRAEDERLVFINAWNEWAEGAYLEPDIRYGRRNLDATKRAIDSSQLYARLRREATDATTRDANNISALGEYFRNQMNLVRASSRVSVEVTRQCAKARLELADTQAKLNSMVNSKSWKITAPLRKVYDLVQRFRTR
jgi:hypothetical protein